VSDREGRKGGFRNRARKKCYPASIKGTALKFATKTTGVITRVWGASVGVDKNRRTALKQRGGES